jgi:phosphomethylpyrimidine synthase
MRTDWISERTARECATQMRLARDGDISGEMRHVAEREGLAPELVRDEVAAGRLVIPANVHHPNLEPIGIGIACKCKINANIGNSPVRSDLDHELEKLCVAVQCGADTVMDLSTGEAIDDIRRSIIAHSTVPVGTVPIYEALAKVDHPGEITVEMLLSIIEKQAEQGVDFMTLHAGLLREHIELTVGRLTGIVSRGGAAMALWMQKHGLQNPLYDHYDDMLEIARKHDVTLSLGDGLRPGCQADANDGAQFAELNVLGELTRRAWERDVQVMIEGPGHVPFDKIAENVEREMQVCSGAPFYVLGPLVTDAAPGYDHIVSAIGGTMAAYAGASMLCYVTPREHLGLPDLEDVKQGVVAHKIAAHAADVARGRSGARDRDDAMSRARFEFDWQKQFELALDPERARAMYDEAATPESLESVRFCTMCGEKFCSMRATHDLRKK